MNLNDKVNQIQQSNELLADSFKHIIYQEMNAITHDLKRQNDEYLQESRRNFTKSIEEITKKADNLMDKQLQQEKTANNMQFYLTIVMYVAIAVVLIRALFFGIWEGLLVKNLYEWGSQWQWLKYTMIGAFIAIIAYIGYAIYSFVKEK